MILGSSCHSANLELSSYFQVLLCFIEILFGLMVTAVNYALRQCKHVDCLEMPLPARHNDRFDLAFTKHNL